jgi:hypothetical protein
VLRFDGDGGGGGDGKEVEFRLALSNVVDGCRQRESHSNVKGHP